MVRILKIHQKLSSSLLKIGAYLEGSNILWRHDIHPNDIQQIDNQHKGIFSDILQYDTQHTSSLHNNTAIMLNVIVLSVIYIYYYAECHYAECQQSEYIFLYSSFSIITKFSEYRSSQKYYFSKYRVPSDFFSMYSIIILTYY